MSVSRITVHTEKCTAKHRNFYSATMSYPNAVFCVYFDVYGDLKKTDRVESRMNSQTDKMLYLCSKVSRVSVMYCSKCSAEILENL